MLPASHCTLGIHIDQSFFVVLNLILAHLQAVKKAHNIVNQDKQKIAKDFAPDKKVSAECHYHMTGLDCQQWLLPDVFLHQYCTSSVILIA